MEVLPRSCPTNEPPRRSGRGRLPILVSLAATAVLVIAACTAPRVNEDRPRATFSDRCAEPGVVRCFGFEEGELAHNGGPIHWGESRASAGVFVNGGVPIEDYVGRVEIASDFKASGNSSLKFFMPSQTGAGFAGQFYANFSADNSVQFSEGDEFYVQWRQRFSTAFLRNSYEPDSNWKQIIVGEGNRDGFTASSCTQLELVVDQDDFGSPSMYHSCGGKDGRYERIYQSWPIRYAPNEWMTFQMRVKIGSWYRNDRKYRRDSIVELWVAREGQASQVTVSENYDLANTRELSKYGKVWLLPYLTRKDARQEHSDAFTWYDELIISRAPIPDPI